MAYEVFLECLLQNLQAALGEEFHFILRPLPRNNGVTLDGLTLQGPGAHLAPTIYLNPYYQKLIHGSSLESIVEEILQLYQTTPPPASLTAESVINFEYLKDKVMFRMIHTASNQVLLSDVPHIPYLDLSIIFFLSLERTATGQVTAMIHNSHARMWKVTARDLWRLARENTPREFPAEIQSMQELLQSMARDTSQDTCDPSLLDLLLQAPSETIPLYVLSNQTGLYGAACMIYQDILKDFAARLEKDLIVLPSSVHEVLLTPDSPDASYEDLSNMVRTINTQEVPLEDQLSNQVYLYTRSDDRIRIVSNSFPPVGAAALS